jgi:hypothetical protein
MDTQKLLEQIVRDELAKRHSAEYHRRLACRIDTTADELIKKLGSRRLPFSLPDGRNFLVHLKAGEDRTPNSVVIEQLDSLTPPPSAEPRHRTVEVSFEGGSDDLFDATSKSLALNEEFGVCEEPIELLIQAEAGALKVVGYYGRNGTWSIGLGPVDDGAPLPDWNPRFSHAMRGNEAGYSAILTLTVPADAKLTRLGKEDE